MYRILSTNVLCWGNEEHYIDQRMPLLTKMLKIANPDSFGVQEAHKEWMDGISAALPEYAYVGVGRDDGAEEGEYSAVFYKKDKFTVEESNTFWLSETPDKPGLGWDARCVRVCTWVKLKDKENGKVYVHMNTHLDHIGIVARVEGVKLIKETAASFGGVPVVCTGDFNVPEGTDCYVEMVKGNMGDSRYMAPDSDNGYTFHAFKPEETQSIIDYVFADKETVRPQAFKVLNFKIDDQFYSDHYAVYADVEL